MNNYEKIKQMSLDEMASYVSQTVSCTYCPKVKNCLWGAGCKDILKTWLESEEECQK